MHTAILTKHFQDPHFAKMQMPLEQMWHLVHLQPCWGLKYALLQTVTHPLESVRENCRNRRWEWVNICCCVCCCTQKKYHPLFAICFSKSEPQQEDPSLFLLCAQFQWNVLSLCFFFFVVGRFCLFANSWVLVFVFLFEGWSIICVGEKQVFIWQDGEEKSTRTIRQTWTSPTMTAWLNTSTNKQTQGQKMMELFKNELHTSCKFCCHYLLLWFLCLIVWSLVSSCLLWMEGGVLWTKECLILIAILLDHLSPKNK